MKSPTNFTYWQKAISLIVIATFTLTGLNVPDSHAQQLSLPKPGVRVSLSPQFIPANLKGIKIHPDNPLMFDFIIDRGDGHLSQDAKKEEYQKLIKYFLASLAVPDENQWVNLSPYEKNRIINHDFGQTEMGRDLLGQDYILKQITASLIYPEEELGKKFWNEVYTKAQAQYGTTNIPINTFNKVWIVPDQALVYEKGNTAYVIKNHLKVMLEEDYISMNNNIVRTQSTNQIGSQITRQIVLPALEKEVNEGQNFAMLRQVYSAMILAAWFKRTLKESFLGKIYADKNKIVGVDLKPTLNTAGFKPASTDIELIYQRYVQAYKKGVFNYIKEDQDSLTHTHIPRKYFSGGTKNNYPEILTVTNDSQLGDAAMSAGVLSEDTVLVAMERQGADRMIEDLDRVLRSSDSSIIEKQKAFMAVIVGNYSIEDMDLAHPILKKAQRAKQEIRIFLNSFRARIEGQYEAIDMLKVQQGLYTLSQQSPDPESFENFVKVLNEYQIIRPVAWGSRIVNELVKNAINRRDGKDISDKRSRVVYVGSIKDKHGALMDAKKIDALINADRLVTYHEVSNFQEVIDHIVSDTNIRIGDESKSYSADVWIDVHGSPDGLDFETPVTINPNEKNAYYLSPLEQTRIKKKLEGRVKKAILFACSSGGCNAITGEYGQNIGGAIQEALGAKDLVAPENNIIAFASDVKVLKNDIKVNFTTNSAMISLPTTISISDMANFNLIKKSPTQLDTYQSRSQGKVNYIKVAPLGQEMPQEIAMMLGWDGYNVFADRFLVSSEMLSIHYPDGNISWGIKVQEAQPLVNYQFDERTGEVTSVTGGALVDAYAHPQEAMAMIDKYFYTLQEALRAGYWPRDGKIFNFAISQNDVYSTFDPWTYTPAGADLSLEHHIPSTYALQLKSHHDFNLKVLNHPTNKAPVEVLEHYMKLAKEVFSLDQFGLARVDFADSIWNRHPLKDSGDKAMLTWANAFSKASLIGFMVTSLFTSQLKAVTPEALNLIKAQNARYGIKTIDNLNKTIDQELNKIVKAYITAHGNQLITSQDDMPNLKSLLGNSGLETSETPNDVLVKKVKERIIQLKGKKLKGAISSAEQNEMDGLNKEGALLIQRLLIGSSSYLSGQNVIQGLIAGIDGHKEYNCVAISTGTVLWGHEMGIDVYTADVKIDEAGKKYPLEFDENGNKYPGLGMGHVLNATQDSQGRWTYLDQRNVTIPKEVKQPLSFDDLILEQKAYVLIDNLFALQAKITDEMLNNQPEEVQKILDQIKAAFSWIEANSWIIRLNADLQQNVDQLRQFVEATSKSVEKVREAHAKIAAANADAAKKNAKNPIIGKGPNGFQEYQSLLKDIDALNIDGKMHFEKKEFKEAAETFDRVMSLVSDHLEPMKKSLKDIKGITDGKGNPVTSDMLIDVLTKALATAKKNKEVCESHLKDRAMSAEPLGGIDFNSAHLDLQIQKDGMDSRSLSFDSSKWDNVPITGLVPRIISIQSITANH